MAKVKIKTETEGYISKYDAYKALCEDLGLYMLTNGTERDYHVRDGVLYHDVDTSYHGSVNEKEEVYTKNLNLVLLFENLLQIKSFL